MNPKPTCQIFFNEKDNIYTLVSYAVDDFFTVAYGEMKRIANNEMNENGYDIIINDLNCFSNRVVSGCSEYELLNDKQRRKFEKENKTVFIVIENDEYIIITPMKKIKGGYQSINGISVKVDIPCSNQTFAERLKEALCQCIE